MTFQRRTAQRVAALVRAAAAAATIVVGGYDPSLAMEVYEDPAWGVDVIVRGEGDVTFRELLRALEAGRRCRRWTALLSATATASSGRRPARSARSAGRRCGCRTAAARVLTGYTFLGRPIDVVETSRGCTFDCSFCSIIEMRGRNFHTWSIERVLEDIADARGARRARDLPGRRQHHTEHPPVRGALPRNRRQRPERHRLPGPGDDLVHRLSTAKRWRR